MLRIRIWLKNHSLQQQLKRQIENFVELYNHQPYHEILDNVERADGYVSQAQSIRKRYMSLPHRQRPTEAVRVKHSKACHALNFWLVAQRIIKTKLKAEIFSR